MPDRADILADRDRRIARFRASLAIVEDRNNKYIDDLLKMRPENITPELFADIQASADDLFMAFGRLASDLKAMWELTEPPWWDDDEPPRVPMDD